MDARYHASLNRLPAKLKSAVFTAATTNRVAVNHLVDDVLGRKVFALYPEGVLQRAADGLGAETRDELVKALGETWPEADEPPWIVLVAGAQARDLDATGETMKRHFKPDDLPVRVEVKHARAWVVARLQGTRADVRDVRLEDAPAGLVDELVAGLVFPPAEPYELREHHADDPTMVAFADARASKDDVIDALRARVAELEAHLGPPPVLAPPPVTVQATIDGAELAKHVASKA